jgi:hypothetical protein
MQDCDALVILNMERQPIVRSIFWGCRLWQALSFGGSPPFIINVEVIAITLFYF